MTRVAVVQLEPVIGQLDASQRVIADALSTLPIDVDVAVLPELALCGYVFTDAEEVRGCAITVSDPRLQRWTEAAARLSSGAGGIVIGGFAELGADGQLYNSVAVVDPGGVLGVYRKVHLWDREKLLFTPGSEPPLVLDTRHGRIAVMICFDLEFPEWYRLAALACTELLAVPTNWPLTPKPDGERAPEVLNAMIAARQNRIVVACADRTGVERGVQWTDGSVIIDVDGWIQASVGSGSGTAIAELDLQTSHDKHLTDLVDVLADRRPELYGGVASQM